MQESATTLVSAALAHHRAERYGEALALYDRALEIAPDLVDALRFGGHAALAMGQAAGAVKRLREATRLDPADHEAVGLLGNALQMLDRHDEALEAYRAALALDPDNPSIRHNLGVALCATGHVADGVASYRRALALAPHYAKAHVSLCQALQGQARYEEAISHGRRAVALSPGDAESLRALGNALYDGGDFEAAVATYERALALAPNHYQIRYTLCLTHLRLGDYRRALDACDVALAAAPGDTAMLGLKAVALANLGERDAARYLVDLDRLLWSTAIDVPSDFGSIGTFNDALETHARKFGEMSRETPDARGRFTKATRAGDYMLGLSLIRPKGPLGAFEKAIEESVASYLRTLDVDPEHPFLKNRPKRWSIDSWGTFIGAQGHQVAHNHHGGWLSGVYYVKIPGLIRDGQDDHAGWIEFGRPASPLPVPPDPEIRLIPPVEGHIVLFPSYFFHRTIPFEADAERISFAFDLRPAD